MTDAYATQTQSEPRLSPRPGNAVLLPAVSDASLSAQLGVEGDISAHWGPVGHGNRRTRSSSPGAGSSGSLWTRGVGTSVTLQTGQGLWGGSVNLTCPLGWVTEPRYVVKHQAGCCCEAIVSKRLSRAHAPVGVGARSHQAKAARQKDCGP